jgi:NADH-quinone oxidoreductase subunit A
MQLNSCICNFFSLISGAGVVVRNTKAVAQFFRSCFISVNGRNTFCLDFFRITFGRYLAALLFTNVLDIPDSTSSGFTNPSTLSSVVDQTLASADPSSVLPTLPPSDGPALANALEVYYFNDFIFIIFALQLFLIGIVGLCLARKNLFLFLVVLEVVYLGLGLLFLSFSIYWFYDFHGMLYAFAIIVLAAAEAAVGLSLLVYAKRLGITLEFSSRKRGTSKFNAALLPLLAVISNLNPYFGWLRFFFVIVIFFTVAVFALQFLFKNFYSKSLQRASVYECGFESFGDARSKFKVSFYVIALLYLIFDIELIFLFPWALGASVIGLFGHLVFLFFLLVLLLGFAYERLTGALQFDPSS